MRVSTTRPCPSPTALIKAKSSRSERLQRGPQRQGKAMQAALQGRGRAGRRKGVTSRMRVAHSS